MQPSLQDILHVVMLEKVSSAVNEEEQPDVPGESLRQGDIIRPFNICEVNHHIALQINIHSCSSFSSNIELDNRYMFAENSSHPSRYHEICVAIITTRTRAEVFDRLWVVAISLIFLTTDAADMCVHVCYCFKTLMTM